MPGFIIDQIRRLKHPRTQRENTDIILTYLAWSGFNAVFAIPLFLLGTIFKSVWWDFLQFVLSLMVLPVMLGPLVSRFEENQWPKIRKWMGWGSAIHPHPKAWDHVFVNGKESWVRITLSDGKLIGGKFGEKSFVSSFPHSEDIFLEQVYELDESTKWFSGPRPWSHGVLIRGDKINLMEFFNADGSDENVGQEVEPAVSNDPTCETDGGSGIQAPAGSKTSSPATEEGIDRAGEPSS